MPTITIRMNDGEKHTLEARAQSAGLNVSEYVRDALALREHGADYGARLDDHERRLGTLEQMAGLA